MSTPTPTAVAIAYFRKHLIDEKLYDDDYSGILTDEFIEQYMFHLQRFVERSLERFGLDIGDPRAQDLCDYINWGALWRAEDDFLVVKCEPGCWPREIDQTEELGYHALLLISDDEDAPVRPLFCLSRSIEDEIGARLNLNDK